VRRICATPYRAGSGPPIQANMRSVCEKLFQRLLKKDPSQANVYYQTGNTQVIVETRQWKLAYSPLEKTKFDISDENAMIIDVPGEHGAHLVPWHMVLRITVNEGIHH
jgi:hypothetical protein